MTWHWTRFRSLSRPHRGQAMLETALVLPIFLLVVFGIFEVGRFVFLKAELENAVREGARLGLVTQPFDEQDVRDRVQQQTGLANATVTPTCDDDPCDYGSTITVEATLPVTVVAGLVPALPSASLTASASVRIE
jgi:Flp pilus assembly protein TadG